MNITTVQNRKNIYNIYTKKSETVFRKRGTFLLSAGTQQLVIKPIELKEHKNLAVIKKTWGK